MLSECTQGFRVSSCWNLKIFVIQVLNTRSFLELNGPKIALLDDICRNPIVETLCRCMLFNATPRIIPSRGVLLNP